MTDAQARARTNAEWGPLKFSHHLNRHLQSHHRIRLGDAAAHVYYLSHADFARKTNSHGFPLAPTSVCHIKC